MWAHMYIASGQRVGLHAHSSGDLYLEHLGLYGFSGENLHAYGVALLPAGRYRPAPL
jgi:hypothetical protein